MNTFRVRPRFTHTVPLPPGEARTRLLQALAEHAPTLEVRAFPDFIGIHTPEAERRYWSPRLFLSLHPDPAGGTRIEGVYGPEIEVWSVFLYGYLITGLLGTFSALYGFAQLVIETYPFAFYGTGGMALGAVLLYGAAQLGQKFGAWQTFRLHQAYCTAFGEPPGLA